MSPVTRIASRCPGNASRYVITRSARSHACGVAPKCTSLTCEMTTFSAPNRSTTQVSGSPCHGADDFLATLPTSKIG